MKRLLLLSLVPLLAFCTPEREEPKPQFAERVSMPNMFTGIGVARAKDKLQAGNITVLDVRTEAEFKQGHIKGALNYNVLAGDFRNKIAKLNKSGVYLVICASGVRSSRASHTMVQMDFQKIFNVRGGMKAWKSAGYPVK